MAPNALIEQSTIFLFLTSPELIYCHNLINGNNVCDQRLLCAAQHSRMQYEKLNYFICNNNDNNGELKYQNTQLSAAAGFISYSRMHLKWEVACHFPLFLRRGAEAKGALYSVPVVRACVLFAPLLSRWRVCERRHWAGKEIDGLFYFASDIFAHFISCVPPLWRWSPSTCRWVLLLSIYIKVDFIHFLSFSAAATSAPEILRIKIEIAQSAKAKNKWETSEKYSFIGNSRMVFERTAAMKWCRTIYFSRSNILLFDIIFHKTVKRFLVFVRAIYRLNLMGSCTNTYHLFMHAMIWGDLGIVFHPLSFFAHFAPNQ